MTISAGHPGVLSAHPAVLAAEGGKHSAHVTHWGDRIGWIIGLLLFVALVYWLMRQGWQWRRTLQSDVPALPQAPQDPGPELLAAEGRYFGTTTAGQWLDRIVAHGLGTRSRVDAVLTEQGLDLRRTAAPGFFVPAAALRGARPDKAIAGKVLPEGGLLVVTWQHGGRLLDTGLRFDDPAEHRRWTDELNRLSPGRADRPGTPSDLSGTPAGTPAGGPAAAPASPAGQHHDKEGAR
ncbi:PH-like domain-containing protein [Actinacidiphila yeochonensis]|uniref:PH-like domain-containing protein n=1 Tax=Actinacidiphila yeochonensis TaxID=89050 RepID=UPI0007C81BAF|nr:hypothetical protein [Actinacidiphila yeochonensis]